MLLSKSLRSLPLTPTFPPTSLPDTPPLLTMPAPVAALVNQPFLAGAPLEICRTEQLMDHRVCFIFLRFTFSPGSLPQLHKRSAPGWHPHLFAWCARRCTPVSTSSAAKHFRLCKFNEQQSNSVPQGTAFSPFPFVATSTNAAVAVI